MNESSEIYEFNWLVIHGSEDQARLQGYEFCPENPDHEPLRGWGETSHDGNPAFCMRLKLSDFLRNPDNSIGLTIEDAALRKLRRWNEASQSWGSPFFGYQFTVYASIIVDDVANYRDYQDMFSRSAHYGETTLFTKPASDSRWEDKVYHISAPTEIAIPDPGANRAYLIVSIYSECTCAQKFTNTLVYVDDLERYIPPPKGGYIWRRFGSNAQEDPQGNAINPDKLDGDWHLVKPIYMAEGSGGISSWINVDGGVPID